MNISTENITFKDGTATVHRWKSPSSFAENAELFPVTRITMTCGGGMGGSQWHEYVERTNRFPEGVTEYTRWDGKAVHLNSAYMVKAENFILVKAKLDVRAWKRASGQHTQHMPDTEEKFFLVEPGTEVRLDA